MCSSPRNAASPSSRMAPSRSCTSNEPATRVTRVTSTRAKSLTSSRRFKPPSSISPSDATGFSTCRMWSPSILIAIPASTRSWIPDRATGVANANANATLVAGEAAAVMIAAVPPRPKPAKRPVSRRHIFRNGPESEGARFPAIANVDGNGNVPTCRSEAGAIGPSHRLRGGLAKDSSSLKISPPRRPTLTNHPHQARFRRSRSSRRRKPQASSRPLASLWTGEIAANRIGRMRAFLTGNPRSTPNASSPRASRGPRSPI